MSIFNPPGIYFCVWYIYLCFDALNVGFAASLYNATICVKDIFSSTMLNAVDTSLVYTLNQTHYFLSFPIIFSWFSFYLAGDSFLVFFC